MEHSQRCFLEQRKKYGLPGRNRYFEALERANWEERIQPDGLPEIPKTLLLSFLAQCQKCQEEFYRLKSILHAIGIMRGVTSTITCQKAEAFLENYAEKNWPPGGELEAEFIVHLKSCRKCMEKLLDTFDFDSQRGPYWE